MNGVAVILPLLTLSAVCGASDSQNKERSEIKEEITIKGKSAGGPPVQVPPPGPDKEVIDEVIHSLDIYKSERKAPPDLKLPGLARLGRPFPEPPYLVFPPRALAAPCESWVFEVFEGENLVWRVQGDGPLKESIEWDGSGASGETAVQAGKNYSVRFSGKSGARSFVLASEPVAMLSLAFKDYLGNIHLEAANFALFAAGKATLKASADKYLAAMGERLRRLKLKDEPYRLTLYQKRPGGKLALARVASLRGYFSQALLINPGRIEVEVLPVGERGDVTACVLAAEEGSSIRGE